MASVNVPPERTSEKDGFNGAGNGVGQGGGRGRRHDTVLRRDHRERRQAEAAGVDRRTGDPPAARRGRVFAVPAPETFARHRGGQRHAIVQPVLQRNEVARLGSVRIEPPEGEELAHHQVRVECANMARTLHDADA